MPPLGELRAVEAVSDRPESLLEAPRICADGTLLFADVLGGGVYALAPAAAEPEVLVPDRRGVGGMVLHADGGVVVSGRGLVRVSPRGEQREVLCPGSDAAGFNDLGVTPEGDLLAGVLRFRPFAGEPPAPGQLIRVGRNGRLAVLTEDVLWPNGIGLTPDGETILLSDFAQRVVLAVPLKGGRAEVFARSPEGGSCDGLAVDAEGRVWVATGEGGTLACFTPSGELEAVIDVPADFVSSIAFGGADGRDVLVTGIGALFTARSEVPGAAVAPATV